MKTSEAFVNVITFAMAWPIALVAHIAIGFWTGCKDFWGRHTEWVRFALGGN